MSGMSSQPGHVRLQRCLRDQNERSAAHFKPNPAKLPNLIRNDNRSSGNVAEKRESAVRVTSNSSACPRTDVPLLSIQWDEQHEFLGNHKWDYCRKF